jgi:DNA-binding NtrC family response regulator
MNSEGETMEKSVRVLVVDDEAPLRDVLAVRLAHWGYECREAASVSEAESLLGSFDPDLVLSDVRMPGVTGLELLRRLKAGAHARIPVILMTAHGRIDDAVEAMKDGAADFLTKPVETEKLRSVLSAVTADLERVREVRALERAIDGEGRLGGLLGRGPMMRELQSLVSLVASTDASALITGESGTGKEVVARAIHDLSARRGAPFIAVNCAAIPENLIESELFGHEKGAFTGAIRARAGCFEMANGGTLFLDELAEMPIALQPKLLRILEDGRARRIGGTKENQFDVRVLAATNRSPASAIQDGRLREDLFYRLNVFDVVVPPLRERPEDIPLLCQHFIREFNRKHGTAVEGPRKETLEALARYDWPGNVRELRNVMERGVVVARDRWLEPAHLPPYIRGATTDARPTLTVAVGTPLAEVEKEMILRTLDHVGNNKAEAARRLGLDVKTIRNKLDSFEDAGA